MPKTEKQKLKKSLAYTFTYALGVIALVFLFFSTRPPSTPEVSKNLNKEGQLFQKLWRADLKQLTKKHLLPKEWKQIKTVKVIVQSDKIRQWKDHLITPVNLNPNGTHHLEILFYSWETKENQTTMMTQYSLYEIKSTRLTWELARNIPIQ